jgi:hypothetical protein
MKIKITTFAPLACMATIAFTLLSYQQQLRAEDLPPEEKITALDNNADPVKSCDGYRDMPALMEGIQIVSWSNGSRICEMVQRSLNGPIPVGAFRMILKASGLMHVKGAGETEDIAYQIAEIIDARGLHDLDGMKRTIDVVFKVYNGSNGRVKPKDLNVFLRQSGRSRTIDDEGLFTIAAMISVDRRNRGE